jgi:hypothetical protein
MPHGSYKISEAAKAAGVTAKKFKRNIDCKVIELPGPKPGKGNHHLLSLKSVYHAAIGFALTKLLVPPDIAINKLAAKFFEPQRQREAGKPFKTGKTLMFVSTDGTGSIINLQADQDVTSFLDEAAIVVDIGRIIENVNSRLLN